MTRHGGRSHGQRLVDFLATTTARASTAPLDAGDPRVAAILDTAACDPVVRALVGTLVQRNAVFVLFGVEVYPGVLLHGKRGEAWNSGGAIVGPRELVIAESGAGDLFVWNADDGSVRFVRHRMMGRAGARYASIDDFLESVFWSALATLDPAELDAASPDTGARIRLAVEISGEDALAAPTRQRLLERGMLPYA